MVSDFISEQDGYLKLSDEEFAIGRTIFPGLKQYAWACIEYGENKDGYWTLDRFMEQLEYSAKIAECKYPMDFWPLKLPWGVCWKRTQCL